MPDFKPWQWITLIALLVVMNIIVIGGLIFVVATYDLWAGPTHLAAEPTVPPWATATATRRPTFTLTFTPQVWPTATPTRTPTRMPSPSPTWTPLPTRTPTITPTPWPTDTPTPYRPPTDTPTPTPTRTRVPTRTPLPTSTWTPTPHPSTNTPMFTPTRTRISAHTALPASSPTSTAEPAPAGVPAIAGQPATATPIFTQRSSPTPTPTPVPTKTRTPTPSPSSTRTPTLTPSPTATASAQPPTETPSPAPTPAADASPVALSVYEMEAAPLADNSISLSWEPIADATAYRIYSDMGTGYGVYLFTTETDQPMLTDGNLRAGLGYRYRVGAVTPAGEMFVAQAIVITPGRASIASAVDTSAPAAPGSPRVAVRVTPAPTPLPPDTIILGLLSAADYADDVEGTITIVGEVRNDSLLDVGQATVIATFYGADGQIIGEASDRTMLQTLPPGARSPFVITLPRPAGVANYSLRASGRPTTAAADAVLVVVNTRRFEDTAGFYHVAGVVENTGDRRVEGARVIVTLYDRGGRVVNVGLAYARPMSLLPGAQADFDVAFTYYPKVFSHRAVAVED